MSEVARLSVQHRMSPHCPDCKADMPTFDNAHISLLGDDGGYKLLGVTWHIRCACGKLLDLKKTVKR